MSGAASSPSPREETSRAEEPATGEIGGWRAFPEQRAPTCLGNALLALELAERILIHLAYRGLEGSWEPARVYLACYVLLKDQADPRAWDVLRDAFAFLMELAARFRDSARKRSFLENLAVHRELVRE